MEKVFDLELVKKVYESFDNKIKIIRKNITKPLTLAEKILYLHAEDNNIKEYIRGKDYVNFFPDRVAMQDATAQMALLQFMLAGKKKVAVPTTVHCDHLIISDKGYKEDLKTALEINKEVYDFLSSVSAKYGIDFWGPGSGIIHQILFENYAFPGGMMIGTDSHTVNAGGLGMIAIGVGGADAVDVMVGMPWELRFPKLIGVKLTGELKDWTSPKDIILKITGMLTVKGGTGYILEYFGEGARKLSCTGKATICNMGAEIGATTSIFGYDEKMEEYLRKTGRSVIAEMANSIKEHITADPEAYEEPEKFFDQIIEINLSELEPHINGPFTPDIATPISQLPIKTKENNWPENMEVGLIGSCTNSSYEDLTRAASIIKQAIDKDIEIKAELLINPGSEKIRRTAERDGILKIFEEAGAKIMANACGACIGQWKRPNADKKERNSIITSFNRNFAGRNDGNPNTHAFIASPEIVAAYTIAGTLNFNPLSDSLINRKGIKVKLDPPSGITLPESNFVNTLEGYQPPAEDGSKIEVIIKPDSERLQLLQPFEPWDGKDFLGLRLLIKVKGKCTTDHISMAGPWLKYRGHLDKISNNLLIGAVNYFNDKTNCVKNQLTGEYDEVPKVQRMYKEKGIGTIVVGDENYGEGSSREHAAMEPRYLGVKAILAKSFARIHETNLKKQGMLALTFINKDDYDKIKEDDIIDIIGLTEFAPEKPLKVVLHHSNGITESFFVAHSYNEKQIEWFKAGSALNLIRKQSKEE